MINITERKNNKIPGLTSLFISCRYNEELIAYFKSLYAFNFDKKTKEWEVPTKQLSEILDKLTFYDDINLKLYKQKEKTSKQDIRLNVSNYKIKPFDYQIDAIKYGLTHRKWLLLDQPGLGKTSVAIHIAEELKKRENIKHCLVVCGVNALKSNWIKEIEKHSNLTACILGQKKKKDGTYKIGDIPYRVECLKDKIDEFFVVTNIESLRSDKIVDAIRNGKNKFDLIIFDEIHTAKNPTAQQSKGLIKINADYKIGMTGTLILNKPLDAYMGLKWINAETATYSNFERYYTQYSGPFNNEFVGYRNLDTLKQLLETCSLRREKTLLNLPPKNIITEVIDMESNQQSFYDNIVHGVVEQVDKVKITPASILGMITRLRQATACPNILTTERIDSAKINRAVELANQIISNGDKVVIFSLFKETVYQLQKELIQYKPLICTGDIDDNIISQNIDMFQNDDEHKIFIGTFAKGGTGITLTKANYMIMVDSTWTRANNEQAEDRIYRIGSKYPVFIYYLVCKDTIDEKVSSIVNNKQAISEYIVDDRIPPKLTEQLYKIIVDLKTT